MRPHPFPRMRWAAAAWLAVWLPAYAAVWGLPNFLHLSDVAVVLGCAGLWAGNALLLSSQAVSCVVVDLFWDADAACRLFTGHHWIGGTEYLFQPAFPLWVRLLSLFHVFWPPLLLWALSRTGYDRRALALQCAIAAGLLLASRALGPALNLNFAFRDPLWGRALGPAPLHLALVFAALAVVVYLPTHLVLARLFAPRA